MLITDQTSLEKFCAELKTQDFITVDTEFLREKTYYPKLCLIQVGMKNGKAAAIDVLEDDINLRPLFNILLDKKIMKVFHAARQDLEIFYELTGQVIRPLFDTQIAAMVCGYGDSVGYESLVNNILGHSLDKSTQYTNWSNRPLSDKQISYALADVTHLVKLYEHLNKELEKRGRVEWVFQEEEILADPATYENTPEDAWQRIKVKSPKPKTLAVLKNVAAWREKRAQDKNMPRGWVMRDDTLADMAAQAPTKKSQLKKIRNMPGDLADGYVGDQLLEAIKNALESDPKTWPQPEYKKRMPANAAATLDILRMLLKVQCMRNDVATKLVASKEDLELLATEDKPEIPAMKGWRYDIFGKDALALKNGDLAIGLKNSKITKYKVSKDSEVY